MARKYSKGSSRKVRFIPPKLDLLICDNDKMVLLEEIARIDCDASQRFAITVSLAAVRYAHEICIETKPLEQMTLADLVSFQR